MLLGGPWWKRLLKSPRITASIHHRQERQEGNKLNNNVPGDTPSVYWKSAMYLPFLDHLVTEINEKLVEPLPGF